MPVPTDQQPKPIALVLWGNFQLAMLADPTYERVSNAATVQRLVSRVELYFSTQIENWPLIGQLWGGMIASCPETAKPTATEVAGWNAIASATNMPFQFNAAGQLIPEENDE